MLQSSLHSQIKELLAELDEMVNNNAHQLGENELREVYLNCQKLSKGCYDQLSDVELDDKRKRIQELWTDPDFAMDMGMDAYYEQAVKDATMMTDSEVIDEWLNWDLSDDDDEE